MSKLIRSSILSTGRATKTKLKTLEKIRLKGQELTKKYIEIVWNRLKTEMNDSNNDLDIILDKHADSKFYKQITTTDTTARFKQVCATKATALVQALYNKQKARLYYIKKLSIPEENESEIQRKKRLKSIDNIKKKMQDIWNKPPEIQHFSLELNANCIEFIKSSSKHKSWIKIKQIFPGEKLYLPYFETKHSKKYKKDGWNRSEFLQITEKNIIKCVFKKPIPIPKSTGNVIGCDIGISSVFALSDFRISHDEKVGSKSYNLVEIYNKICKSKVNSNHCKRLKTHAINYCNRVLNNISLSNIKELHTEDLKDLRFGRKCRPFLRCWRYPVIMQKIDSLCEENGINHIKISKDYTSQRCSLCGWVQKDNRKNKLFRCLKCTYSCDADINAAKNLSFLNENDIIKGNSLIGFYYKIRRLV